MAEVIAHQGDTLDALCWRHYGRTAGVVEAVLEANPRLADLGPLLPHGQRVTLPEQAPTAQRTDLVNLWD